MPKRLKSGFGHHRLQSCGPSNGRHKIAQDHLDFFPLLRSLPSDIDDALDTPYEPNAVFSQFLGSGSMTFLFLFFFLLIFFLLLSFLDSSCLVLFLLLSCLFLFFPFLFFVSIFSRFFPFLYLIFISLFNFFN